MTPSQKRASLILQVRAGQLTAQEAARQLGISRQAYYQWEKRALSALLAALEEQPKGRPKRQNDPEKEQLQIRVKELQAKLRLYEEKERLRKLVQDHDWEVVHPGLAPTISLGVCADAGLGSGRRMIDVADQRMYDAKRSGRNRVC